MNKTQRYKKYLEQRKRAKQRNIPWELTYLQWYRIWLGSGHWHERGRETGQYVMARYGDTGPYSPKNVKIITNSENSSEGNLGNQHTLGKKHSPETRAKISAAMMGHQNAFGYKHTPEALARMSTAQKGNQNALGKKYSPKP